MKGVFCYRNLNRKGVVWSVRSNRTGLVIRRSGLVVLENVRFKVSLAGHARVIKQKRKNVHAGALGTLIGRERLMHFYTPHKSWYFNSHGWIKVFYNPFCGPYLQTKRGRKVLGAKFMIMRHDGAWVKDPVYGSKGPMPLWRYR